MLSAAVLDASVVVELLRWSPAGEQIAADYLTDDVDLHIPHLCVVEVASVFRSLVARREVATARAGQAIGDLENLPATRHPAEPLLARVWSLRDDLTAYDATYVALSEALDVPLITSDRRLARSSGHVAEIRLVST